jgi:hypothetical protein
MVRLPPPEFEVRYRAFSFPTGVMDGNGKLCFTADELAHALIATGRAPGDRGRYGWASAYEWMHRASLIPAYLRRRYDGQLVRSRLASELDRSELVGLSYALGQATTALFCHKELSVTHLLHIDRYADQHRLRFGGRKRADLFGIARQGWVVAEAVPEAISIPANLDQFMFAYYLPFVTAIDLGQAAGRDTNRRAEQLSDTDGFVTAGSLAHGLRVGVLPTIYERMQRAIDGQLHGLGGEIQAALLEEEATARPNLFPDGTAVTTDWAATVTTQDWAE